MNGIRVRKEGVEIQFQVITNARARLNNLEDFSTSQGCPRRFAGATGESVKQTGRELSAFSRSLPSCSSATAER